MCLSEDHLMFLFFPVYHRKNGCDLLLLYFSFFNLFLGLWTHIFEIIHHFYFLLESGHLDINLYLFFLELGIIEWFSCCSLGLEFAYFMFQSRVTLIFTFSFHDTFISWVYQLLHIHPGLLWSCFGVTQS